MFGIAEAVIGAIVSVAVDVGAAVLGAGLAGSVGLIGTEVVGASMIGLAGFGLVEGISAMTSTPGQPAQATAPNTATAQQTATEAQTAQRRSALAAGAGTNITQGSGIILGSDISSVTLTGSA